MTFLLPLVLLQQQDSPASLLKRVQSALDSGRVENVAPLFSKPEDASYLGRVGKDPNALKKMTATVFPAPQGWESAGRWWLIMSAHREVEADHDLIFPVVSSPRGLRLGAEIPEWRAGGRIKSMGVDARIHAGEGSIDVSAGVSYTDATPGKAMLFRLNNLYQLQDIQTTPGKSLKISQPPCGEVVSAPPAGSVMQVGGLVAVTPPASDGTIQFRYRGKLGAGEPVGDERDQILPDRAYVTGYWVPILGRLPFTTQTTIQGPKDWVIRSEGKQFPLDFSPPDVQSVGFRCDVPISFPKIVGGRYVIAAEGEANGKRVVSYQFEPVDKKRAKVDVEWMEKAMEFYEENLGPFPFGSYECFDGKGYYGIESYSYTILAPDITSWAVSHEMGHTYFGGLVPCAYVRDTWNEGVTQYVDSVLLHEDSLASRAYQTIDNPRPLTKMDVAWEDDGITYFRGGYVMQMLEEEIGQDEVLEGLRLMIKDRVGKDTVWTDLRPYFEKSSGKDLKWFWAQWIENGKFPTVTIEGASTRQQEGKWVTQVKLRQSGTPKPFRLRFALDVGDEEQAVEMDATTASLEFETKGKPETIEIDAQPYSLIHIGPPVEVRGS